MSFSEKIDFLRELSLKIKASNEISNDIERSVKISSWNKKIDSELVDLLVNKRGRAYNYHNSASLIFFIRNLVEHYGETSHKLFEKSNDVQVIHENVGRYFFSEEKFQDFFLELWSFCKL